LFGVYLAIRYNTRQQLQLLTVAFLLIILSSFIVALGAPHIGIMHGVHEGIWRGVFLHKNGLGSCMVLAGIVAILLTMEVSKYRWIFHLGFWLALILLCLACSKSALLSWIILFLSLGVYFARSSRPKMAVIASLSVTLAVCSFTLQYKYKVMPPILLAQITTSIASQGFGHYAKWENIVSDFEAVQRGAPIAAHLDTGGGRLRLWGHLSKKIQDRPWLGYGVGGFWRGMHGPSADIWKLEPWRPTHAHNGFIDVWLDLGAIGLSVILLSITTAIFCSITTSVNHYLVSDLLFPLAIISGLCLLKIGEGGLLGANSLTWILFVAAVINVQMRLRRSGERSVSSRSPITYNKRP
jgi:O-antigen ligase